MSRGGSPPPTAHHPLISLWLNLRTHPDQTAAAQQNPTTPQDHRVAVQQNLITLTILVTQGLTAADRWIEAITLGRSPTGLTP